MLIFCDILIARLHISNRLRKGDFYAMVMVVLLIWSGIVTVMMMVVMTVVVMVVMTHGGSVVDIVPINCKPRYNNCDLLKCYTPTHFSCWNGGRSYQRSYLLIVVI